MYTVVLMAAMTHGGEAVDFGGRRACFNRCYSSHYSGCYYNSHYVHGRYSGCCNSGTVYSHCYQGPYYHGTYTGCHGGVVVVPNAGTTPPAGGTGTPPQTGTTPPSGGTPPDTGTKPPTGGTPPDTGKQPQTGTAPGDGGKTPPSGTAPGDGGKAPETGTAPGDAGKAPSKGTAPGDAGKAPPKIEDNPPAGTAPEKPGKAPTDAPAVIDISAPVGANISVDGTQVRGTRLISPALPNGRDYHYDLSARININGQTYVQSQRVAVRAGQTTNVVFDFESNVISIDR